MQVGAIIGVKGKFKHSRATPVLSNTNLFKRDILTCGYCGKHFPESQLTRDHIVPVSKGGRDVWQNVVACCKKCNSHKGNKMLDDCGMNLLWVPYVPCRNETLILSNRNILFDQAQYIAGFLKKDSRAPRYLEEHLGIVLQ
jgi:5-methylcytosine-specific restriction endonuclease McrA